MARGGLAATLAVAVVVTAVLLVTDCAATPDGIFEIGHLLQQDSEASGAGRNDCQSRRGVLECREIGDDCEKTYLPLGCDPSVAASCERFKVSFPMKQVTVTFPCADGFRSRPMVFAYILGSNTNKMFTTSVVHTTETSFTANVQRTDDVDNPQLTCDPIQICYFALPVN